MNPLNIEDIRYIDAFIPDLNAVLRGKRIAVREFAKLREFGVLLPGTIFATDITGLTVDVRNRELLDGEPDLLCRMSAENPHVVPWEDQVAQAFLSMCTLDGEPFFADPQHVLSSVLDRLHASGLRPVMALELEFYLTEYDGARLQPKFPVSPSSGEREWGVQVYGMNELWDFKDFLNDVDRYCLKMGVPASAASSEYGPGQFEINLSHTEDIHKACEHALLLKQAVRSAARRYGWDATFMAKPYIEQAGNGCHVHVSILDNEDTNIFSSDKETGSEQLHHAIGGLAATMPDCMALFAPGANSYRRFVKGAYAPVQPSWGVNNRTVALRIPVSDADSRRVEHRVAGADVNPWLLCASVLAGIQFGLERKIVPPVQATGSACENDLPTLPDNWENALDKFRESEFIQSSIGAKFADLYYTVKQHERAQFERQVTPLEIQWYLRRS